MVFRGEARRHHSGGLWVGATTRVTSTQRQQDSCVPGLGLLSRCAGLWSNEAAPTDLKAVQKAGGLFICEIPKRCPEGPGWVVGEGVPGHLAWWHSSSRRPAREPPSGWKTT